jgi:hypothetical protein
MTGRGRAAAAEAGRGRNAGASGVICMRTFVSFKILGSGGGATLDPTVRVFATGTAIALVDFLSALQAACDRGSKVLEACS